MKLRIKGGPFSPTVFMVADLISGCSPHENAQVADNDSSQPEKQNKSGEDQDSAEKPEAKEETADTVYTNGNIYTVNAKQPWTHIESQFTGANLPLPAKMHFVAEPPDVAIMNCIEQHGIELLMMGTVGRTGTSGFITGNTAERLLPRIPCSLLAVKPPGFKSPVSLGST